MDNDLVKSIFSHGGVHGTALFSREAWSAAGGFPEEAEAVPGEDVVFLTRMARCGFGIDVVDTEEHESEAVFAINRFVDDDHCHAWRNFCPAAHAATTVV